MELHSGIVRLAMRTSLSAESPERVGGRYRLGAVVGRGGTGIVYEAIDELAHREVALKRLRLDRVNQADALALRFRREFHVLATLKHPRIIEAYDFGVEEGTLYYTMELLRGRALGELAPLQPVHACSLLRDLASALAFLHARQLIHRDISPRNVIVVDNRIGKLIDFGSLASPGMQRDINGTVAFTAPEAARHVPIDHRADLYSLGATAYFLLTGRLPFAVRNFDEVRELGKRLPEPPSAFAPAVPPALDALVMLLLSPEPAARPTSAAEVIDRLGVLGGLERAPELQTALGYVESAATVGNREELAQARRALQPGGTVVIEAPSGFGKTRLLRELELEAKTAGRRVIQTSGSHGRRGPYGVLRALARGVLLVEPEVALDAVRATGTSARLLADAVPELAARLPVPRGKQSISDPHGAPRVEQSADPREARLLLQSAIVDWLSRVSQVLPLVILIDDVQRADEASLAVLAVLAGKAEVRLRLAVTNRTDEPARAPIPLEALLCAATRVTLRAFDQEDIEALVVATFGPNANGRRFAHAVHRASAGSPLLATEVFRHLIKRGVVRHVDGEWILPEELGPAEVPRGLIDAMDQHIARLDARALALGQALSVHGGTIPIETCFALADRPDASDVFAGIDGLVHEGVLVGDGTSYQFAHDAHREALLRTLEPDRKRALHLRAGNVLLAQPTASGRELEIGWHLLHGGDAARGAELLAGAGKGLFKTGAFADAIGPLEAALPVFEASRRPLKDRLELRCMLTGLGFFSDRRLIERYARPTMEQLRACAGLKAADRIRRFAPNHLSLVLGALVVMAIWLVCWPTRRRRPTPLWALTRYMRSLVYASAAAAISFDFAALDESVAALEPFSSLEFIPPGKVRLYVKAIERLIRGHYRAARSFTERFLAHTFRPGGVSELEGRLLEGGARLLLAGIHLREGSPKCLPELERVEALGVSFLRVGALQGRIAYHLCRGEVTRVAALERELEVMCLQLGPSLQNVLWWPSMAGHAAGFARDVLAFKRLIEHLETSPQIGLQGLILARARGEYLREVGDLKGSRAALDEALALLDPRGSTQDSAVYAAMADTRLAAGDATGAAIFARRGVERANHPEHLSPGHAIRCARTLALAEADLGDVRGARERLLLVLRSARAFDNPVLTGSVHEALADLARRMGDRGELRVQADAVAACYRPTENPVLIARAERLAFEAERFVSGVTRPIAGAKVAGAAPAHGFTDGTELELDGTQPAALPTRREGRGHSHG